MAEKVLVTGGTGFVAGWMIRELRERGYDVRATVRTLDRAPADDDVTYVVADLTADAGWDDAVRGIDYVLHVASPLTGADPVAPARDGTLRVLRAATRAGVRRVVITSAANTASPSSYAEEGVTDETLWTDPDDPALSPYRRSKTVAERAAWDFMASYAGPTTLATVLPGAVFGPVLSPGNLGSVSIVERMVNGRMRGVPRIGLEVVDVRDLADLHLRAMTAPEAAGERFLGTGEFLWMREMAVALKAATGRTIPTRELPDFAVRVAARFDPSLRAITVSLGRRNRHSTAKAARLLGWKPRPATETVVECARSLIMTAG